jgi:hypothetical protein
MLVRKTTSFLHGVGGGSEAVATMMAVVEAEPGNAVIQRKHHRLWNYFIIY